MVRAWCSAVLSAFQRDVGVGEGRKGLPSHPIESFESRYQAFIIEMIRRGRVGQVGNQ